MRPSKTAQRLSEGRSRFAGQNLSELLLVPRIPGHFDDEVWHLDAHPDAGSSSAQGTLAWANFPTEHRNGLKELTLLAMLPGVHGVDCETVFALPPKDLGTVIRWFNSLPIDLAWLDARAGSLADVRQRDLDAWLTQSGFTIDHRRVRALLAFAEYSEAFTPGIPRIEIEPWKGRSALSIAGGKRHAGPNTTTPLHFDDLGPLLLAAMTVIKNADTLLRVIETDDPTVRSDRRDPLPVTMEALDSDHAADLILGTKYSASVDARIILASCSMFLTAAFTGMRPTEVEAVPRDEPVDELSALGVTRPLVVSYLLKAHPHPKREKWLAPPVVADAIRAMQRLLDVADIPADMTFTPTGQPPLFDRRALAKYRKDGKKATMRFDRVVTAVVAVTDSLAALGLVPPPTSRTVTGIGLRRTFARVVSSRPGGAHAAMEQFKWQQPRTALGYFHVAPDDLALAQRELYNEIRELERAFVLDTAVTEFDRWKHAVDRGKTPLMPTGPGADRLLVAFRAVNEELTAAGVVVEDERRLRQLLDSHTATLHVTEYGFCNFDPQQALCGGTITPDPAMCRPNECLNATTTMFGLAAHKVKHERLVVIAKDTRLPRLARDRIKAEAAIIERDLGTLLEKPDA